jgi:NAD(P)-dependent dehydrogenase (short-subunit alcohol dehydrogenase family)
VVIGDIDLAEERMVEAIEGEKGDVIFVRTDVRDRGQVQNLVATVSPTD